MQRGRKLRLGALIVLGAAAVAAFVVVLVGFDPYRIPSPSMEPTVRVGDRLLVKSIGGYEPERGDIVVFTPPDAAETGLDGEVKFVHRIVALGGDRVAVEDGHAVVDGERVDEPYARAEPGCELCHVDERLVPAGHVYVMGDNRGASADSRDWGPVPEDRIDGEVVLRYWPPARLGKP